MDNLSYHSDATNISNVTMLYLQTNYVFQCQGFKNIPSS